MLTPDLNTIELDVKTIEDIERIENAINILGTYSMQLQFDTLDIEKEIAYLRDGQQVHFGNLRGRKHPIPETPEIG